MRFADDNHHADDGDDDVSAPKHPEGDPRSFCSNLEKVRQRASKRRQGLFFVFILEDTNRQDRKEMGERYWPRI